METITNIILLSGFVWIVIHELDAIRQAEWRFFFGWAQISDEAAYRAFTADQL